MPTWTTGRTPTGWTRCTCSPGSLFPSTLTQVRSSLFPDPLAITIFNQSTTTPLVLLGLLQISISYNWTLNIFIAKFIAMNECHDRHNCHNCHNCRDCHDCHNCHDCHDCHDCHNCHDHCHKCRIIVKIVIIFAIFKIVVIAESSSSSSTAAPGLQTKTALSGRRCAMRGGTCTFCLFFCLFFFFYWTLVRSLFIIVNGSVTHSCAADLTDVTLADEDTCSMLFDGLNWDYW